MIVVLNKSRLVLGAKRPMHASFVTKVNKTEVSEKGEKEFKELNNVIEIVAETDIYIKRRRLCYKFLSHLYEFPPLIYVI